MAKKKTGKNNSVLKVAVIGIVLACMIAGYYFYLSRKTGAEADKIPEVTAVDEVLARNLETNYPPTPKEVVKYYSELTRCFYNEEYTQGQMEKMADKIRQLYDEELLAHNEWGSYIIQLQMEIDEYKEKERKISTYQVSASTDVDEFSMDGYEWAKLHCLYNMRQGGSLVCVDEIFLLRKDEEGHWKIFGWELAKENDDK